jgi:hypothetical protein
MAGERGSYDPREFRALTFHDHRERFRDGSDTPISSTSTPRG